MNKDLENIKFKYTFRDYQLETLNMLEKYKNDKKIHIVASPGAGKTILSLELLLRIGKKALILVPTIAIKEQWIERLKKDFINGDKDGIVSTDLENPSTITVITYQALYSLNRKKINIKQIIKKNNIHTIILDEAHHLRKVWFKTLQNIVDDLKECTTISLTATPPYDNGQDFINYTKLCGNIDAKITIPQLVKSKCLCPHHDYIYFNFPTVEQEKKLQDYNKQIDDFINILSLNTNFIKAIALHDYIINAEENISNILEDFDFYIAMLSFLKFVNCKYPINKFNKNIHIPKFDKEFLQIILQQYLFEKNIEEKEIFEDTFKNIKHELNSIGSIDKKIINLQYTKELSDILLKNSGKLDSIKEIIKTEKENLKENLKLVIVTDYIKEEYYDIQDENDISEIGVIPIFRKILSSNLNIKMAVLTGSVIIIPTELKENLLQLAQKEYNIEKDYIKITELGIDFNYSKVEFNESSKRYSVNLITKLFHNTDINVLIGTVSLIGEGWDAPFVNSLIMASFVSSYVTSNQVRGRAIRIDKKNPEKVSNIWHLICLEKSRNNYILGQDYNILSKRFFAYEGLDINKNRIDFGIERLNIKNKKYKKEEILALNETMINLSKNRTTIKDLWKISLKKYRPISIEKIPLPKLYRKSGLLRKSQKITLYITEALILFGMYRATLLGAMNWNFWILFFPVGYIFEKLNNSEKNFINHVCRATLSSMKRFNKIDSKSKYYVEQTKNNIVFGLKNADTYEQNLFISSVKQAINLNSDSRYICKIGNRIISIPDLFDKNKSDATVFYNSILSIFKGKLIYTKSEKGKKTLLKYKMRELKN